MKVATFVKRLLIVRAVLTLCAVAFVWIGCFTIYDGSTSDDLTFALNITIVTSILLGLQTIFALICCGKHERSILDLFGGLVPTLILIAFLWTCFQTISSHTEHSNGWIASFSYDVYDVGTTVWPQMFIFGLFLLSRGVESARKEVATLPPED